MHLLHAIPVISAALVLCSGFTSADDSDARPFSLSFYTVNKEKVEGWKYIDLPKFPKLGYIAPTPDLIINQLKAVEPYKAQSILITTDANGQKQTKLKEGPGFKITLLEEDAERFTTLSNLALNHQVLVMLGETPLIAPMMRGPITSPQFTLDMIDAGGEKKIERALMKLVK